MGSIGIPGLILILILALVLFGPKKLPELGRAVGHTLKEFKNATRSLTSDEEDDDDAKRKELAAKDTSKDASTAKAAVVTEKDAFDREKIEREVRERIERERLEKEIREKLEMERTQLEKEQQKA